MQAVEQAIRDFHERVTDAEKVLDALDDVFSWSPDSQMFKVFSALVGGYVSALGAAYHIEGWLEWWWIECRLGKNPLRAASVGEEMRTISTVDDLVSLVLLDLAKSA